MLPSVLKKTLFLFEYIEFHGYFIEKPAVGLEWVVTLGHSLQLLFLLGLVSSILGNVSIKEGYVIKGREWCA